jgi:uncharacterized protein (DUF169 family)
MPTIKEYNANGAELGNKLKLRTFPIAVKMLEKEDDIPAGAFRPKRDKGAHLAQCQAFAMSRRDGLTVAMLKEDNWCFAPLIAYGLVEKPDDPAIQKFLRFPRFDRGKYIGIVSAPLNTAGFEPDTVVVYCDAAQLRTLLMPFHFSGNESAVKYHFFPPACSYTVVSVIIENKIMVTLPDIGEDMRTIAGRDEIIISIPKDRLDEAVKGLDFPMHKDSISPMLNMADFPRPEFYKNLFRNWGLDSD